MVSFIINYCQFQFSVNFLCGANIYVLSQYLCMPGFPHPDQTSNEKFTEDTH